LDNFVIQILDETGFLAKCYKVTETAPIREVVEEGRTQVVLTNQASFEAIKAAFEEHAGSLVCSYEEYGGTISCSNSLVYSYNEQTGIISCGEPVNQSWNKD
jgi:hypothetical protein